jgi:hypothetical protein
MTFFCHKYRLPLIIWLLSYLQVCPTVACRYNVRESGFVDIGIEPYYLCGFVDVNTPADVISDFQQVLQAGLMDTNVKFEIIHADQQKKHPAMNLLDLWQLRTLPSAVLVSPDGQSIVVPVTRAGHFFKETLVTAVADIVRSPKRKEILQNGSKAYGIVLVIEGTNEPENEAAREASGRAIEAVKAQIPMMPKPIAYPPQIVTMDRNAIRNEKILLWSLGLDPEKVDEPHAAVLYGRARWIGPLFKGEQITADNLSSVLFVIGADCECGFDHRWLQGTMLPVKWSQEIRAQAAKSLGFDPENPIIQMEISRIIRRGFYHYPTAPSLYQQLIGESLPHMRQNAFEGPESDSAAGITQAQPVQAGDTASPGPSERGPVPEKPVLADAEALWQKPLYFITGLTALVIAAGLFIALRAARRNLWQR